MTVQYGQCLPLIKVGGGLDVRRAYTEATPALCRTLCAYDDQARAGQCEHPAPKRKPWYGGLDR